MKTLFRWVISFVGSLLFLVSLQAAEAPHEGTAAGESGREAPAPETVTIWGRELARYRLPMEFVDVHQRARAAEDRISRALGEVRPESLALQSMQVGNNRGVVVTAGPRFLLKIMEGDLDAEAGERLEIAGTEALAGVRELVRDHAAQQSMSVLIHGGVEAVVATVLFAGFWIGAAWLRAFALKRFAREALRAGYVFRVFGYDWRPALLGVARIALRLAVLILVLAGAYVWATYVLGRFPYTRHWGSRLGEYLWLAVSNLGSGAVRQIPDLVALLVIYLATRGAIRIFGGWFTAIESGRHLSTLLDPESARATRRLANIGIWITALIVAFPYLPGSHSEAFKGVSVFLGLMLSIGGAGFVGQIIGGLAAVYSRAVRTGDYIIVGGTEGTVKELGLLTTKVVTRNREEVTVPNSVLITSAIRNLSRAGDRATLLSTTATIGYDAPWRQVQALLLESARNTEGILADPAPFVQQTALDDFYVRYELNAWVADAGRRGEVLDRLHARIQDAFNERGVQIMSPHFQIQPGTPVVVPKERWFAAPARPRTEGLSGGD